MSIKTLVREVIRPLRENVLFFFFFKLKDSSYTHEYSLVVS